MRPTTSQTAGGLITATFFSFFPLFVWKHSHRLLALATCMTFVSFLFIGAASLFGSPQTVISIAWGGRRSSSDAGAVFFGRVMGAICLAFILFCAYEIFQGGLTAAYRNLGR
jgi:hypothetical protein